MAEQRNSEAGKRGGWRSVQVCDDCWKALAGRREPIRLVSRKREACYRCGALNTSGIYIRRQVEE